MLKNFLRFLFLASEAIVLAVVIWQIIILVRANQQAVRFAEIQMSHPATSISSPTPFKSPTVMVTATSTPTAIPPTAILPTATLAFTEQMSIGHSAAGRTLNVVRFGAGSIHRLIIGGIHGGSEANTVQLAEKIVDHLNANPDAIPPDVTLYILPVLNVDGYERSSGSSGRANENGVDINRNFGAFWALDWPRDGCWNYGPISAGTAPDSEPETRALETFLLEHKIDALISYHSAALGIFAGGQPPDQNSISLAQALHAVSDYPYPPVETGCLYTGQLIDWASMHNIAAVDIELSTHNGLDSEINLKVLNRFLNWTR